MFKKLDNETIALKEKIHLITKYQKPHIANSLKIMAQKSPSNVKVICDYIFAEQNEINIKESTKEGKIKFLVRLLRYLRYKPFENISKQDILDYLTSLKARRFRPSTQKHWNIQFKANDTAQVLYL